MHEVVPGAARIAVAMDVIAKLKHLTQHLTQQVTHPLTSHLTQLS